MPDRNNGVTTQQELGLNLSTRRTRKAVFLDELNVVVPWTELLSPIAPHAPHAKPNTRQETLSDARFQDLLVKAGAFFAEAERDVKGERAAVIAEIIQTMERYGLTLADLKLRVSLLVSGGYLYQC